MVYPQVIGRAYEIHLSCIFTFCSDNLSQNFYGRINRIVRKERMYENNTVFIGRMKYIFFILKKKLTLML